MDDNTSAGNILGVGVVNVLRRALYVVIDDIATVFVPNLYSELIRAPAAVYLAAGRCQQKAILASSVDLTVPLSASQDRLLRSRWGKRLSGGKAPCAVRAGRSRDSLRGWAVRLSRCRSFLSRF